MTHRIRVSDDIMTKNDCRSCGRSEERRQDSQRCRFARAIRTDEAEKVSFVHRQIKAGQGGHVAVHACETVGLNCRNWWRFHGSLKSKILDRRKGNAEHRVLVRAFRLNLVQGLDGGIVFGPGEKDCSAMLDFTGEVQTWR